MDLIGTELFIENSLHRLDRQNSVPAKNVAPLPVPLCENKLFGFEIDKALVRHSERPSMWLCVQRSLN